MAGPLPDAAAVSIVRPGRRRAPRSLWAGAVIVAAVAVAAVAGPLVAPFPYDEMHFGDRLQAPSRTYVLGTDEFGRDVLSRTLVGARLSLFMGVAATFVCMALGVPIGLIAGYHRGRVDELIMRAMDVVMSFPPILLALLILAV